ncbi:MAG TPA: nucleotide exchange factor GrpE [Caulobacteraceae bacterium]|jgi:molecular chaperone GrpE
MTEEDPAATNHFGGAEEEAGADEVAGLRSEVAALKDQAMRYAAEVENTKRRAEREINDARAYAIQKFARDLLGVADNLSRALAHAPKDGDDPLARNLGVGLELTQKELMSAFERNGLKRLAPRPGDKFDPHQHQAMTEQTSATVAPGSVIDVMQDGYELFGRIVRPAMVVVSARDSAVSPAPENPTDSPA